MASPLPTAMVGKVQAITLIEYAIQQNIAPRWGLPQRWPRTHKHCVPTGLKPGPVTVGDRAMKKCEATSVIDIYFEPACPLCCKPTIRTKNRKTEIMNEPIDESKRSRGELALFGVTFLGFILAAAGIVINSGRVAILGASLMAVCLLCFLLMQE